VLSLGTNDLLRTNVGRLYVPPYNEGLQYDADGNLTGDGQWTYVWDAENRLTTQETTATAAARGVPRRKLVYGYDWMGRRVSKVVSNWTGSAWALATAQRYVYDGWKVVAILDGGSSALVASFVWGNDLSGTREGAGGIGGLLAMTVHSGTNAGTYFYAYDGNGNVVGLVNAATGQWAAQYEYGPFGEPIRATGPVAFLNPFRFSTKYCDDETGHYYYGYRYYSPTQGRWLSRDPIGEYGGINLYNFVGNNPVTELDPLGLWNLWNPATWGDRNPDGWSFWNSLTPWHESSGYTLNDLKQNTIQGTEAFIDGIIPFWDPFAENGFYDPCDNALRWSRRIGELTRDIEIALASGPRGPLFGKGGRTWRGSSGPGVLNTGDNIRIGWSWSKSKQGLQFALRGEWIPKGQHLGVYTPGWFNKAAETGWLRWW